MGLNVDDVCGVLVGVVDVVGVVEVGLVVEVVGVVDGVGVGVGVVVPTVQGKSVGNVNQ